MNCEEVYSIFHALKLHFNSTNYDFHKFHGRIKAVLKPIDKDYWCYQKLASYDNDTILGLCISNIIKNPKIYIRNLLSDESKEEFYFWQNRVKNKEDILLLQMKYIIKNRFPDVLEQLESENKYQLLSSLFFQELLSLESIILLNEYFKFTKNYIENDNIIFDHLFYKLKKYKPFFNNLEFSKIQKIIIFLENYKPSL